MTKMLGGVAIAIWTLVATAAFAQQGPDKNPYGFDYGPFHPPVPPQVTTYYPPEPSAVSAVTPRKHHRSRTLPD